MCSYGLNAEEIANAMEAVDVEGHCEGDFYEKTFLEGAKLYIKRLRERGADIPFSFEAEIKKVRKPTEKVE